MINYGIESGFKLASQTLIDNCFHKNFLFLKKKNIQFEIIN